jgi:UDP:flavonoid glycosyltransferase YjiC (YdhE family)
MRVLAACSLGGSVHLQPLVPFLAAARNAGHETLIAGPPALRDMVGATGFSFVAGDEPPGSVIAPIRERLPIVPAREASILANRELFGALATDAMLPAMRDLIASWRPDLVLRDPCEYASAIAAHELDVPVAQVAIGLAAVEWGSIDVAAPALEERQRGLPERLRGSVYLSRFPASLDPTRFRRTRRYDEATGPGPPAALPDWWNGSTSPLVYISFGTVLGHMTIAAEVYRTALRAAGELDARVLLTVGRSFDPESLGPTPDHVHVESWVDQSIVFHEAGVVLCLGGSGTTFGALRAGVPLVVLPLFADQRVNANLVAESGSGIVVALERDRGAGRPPLDRGDAPVVAQAIRSVLADPAHRRHVRRISEEMAGQPSCDDRLRALLAEGTAA